MHDTGEHDVDAFTDAAEAHEHGYCLFISGDTCPWCLDERHDIGGEGG